MHLLGVLGIGPLCCLLCHSLYSCAGLGPAGAPYKIRRTVVVCMRRPNRPAAALRLPCPPPQGASARRSSAQPPSVEEIILRKAGASTRQQRPDAPTELVEYPPPGSISCGSRGSGVKGPAPSAPEAAGGLSMAGRCLGSPGLKGEGPASAAMSEAVQATRTVPPATPPSPAGRRPSGRDPGPRTGARGAAARPGSGGGARGERGRGRGGGGGGVGDAGRGGGGLPQRGAAGASGRSRRSGRWEEEGDPGFAGSIHLEEAAKGLQRGLGPGPDLSSQLLRGEFEPGEDAAPGVAGGWAFGTPAERDAERELREEHEDFSPSRDLLAEQAKGMEVGGCWAAGEHWR